MGGRWIWCAVVILLATLPVVASANKQGYSYIGFGYEHSDYRETLEGRFSDGADFSLETDYQNGNVGQVSGTHIRINSAWGAHLIQGATISANADRERWELNGATAQSNGMVVQNTYLKLLGDWGITSNSSLLFGLGHQSFEFDRFDFEVTQEGSESGISAPAGSVTENGLSLVAIGGYQWSDFFTKAESPWYSRVRLLLETPLYHEVSNTSLDASDKFTDSFNGYNAIASASIGYRVTRHITFAFDVRAAYQMRDEASRTGANGEPQVLPENRYYTLKPALVAYWSY